MNRVADKALVEDADRAAPYLLPCNTPLFYNIDGDIDYEPVAPGSGHRLIDEALAKVIPAPAGCLDAPLGSPAP